MSIFTKWFRKQEKPLESVLPNPLEHYRALREKYLSEEQEEKDRKAAEDLAKAQAMKEMSGQLDSLIEGIPCLSLMSEKEKRERQTKPSFNYSWDENSISVKINDGFNSFAFFQIQENLLPIGCIVVYSKKRERYECFWRLEGRLERVIIDFVEELAKFENE